MYAMNIQNDVIGLVLRENCESKQVMTLLHDRADVTVGYINHVFTFKRKPCYCFLEGDICPYRILPTVDICVVSAAKGLNSIVTIIGRKLYLKFIFPPIPNMTFN